MKTPVLTRMLRGALALPLLLGVPLLAQGVPAPTYRILGAAQEVAITTTYREAVPQLLLVAPDCKIGTIGGVDFLLNGVVVGLVPRTREAEWTLPFPPIFVAKWDLHVQALVLDQGQVVGGPIVAMRELFAPDRYVEEEYKGALAKVRRRLERVDAGGYRFVAEFTATSDGFALYHAAVVRHGEFTDVYLTLKTPGPGEGFLDLMQELQAAVELGAQPGAQVRVFAYTDPAPFAVALDRYFGLELHAVVSDG